MWNKITGLFKDIKSIFSKNANFEQCQKDLETLLITHDVNIKTAEKLVKGLKKSDDPELLLDQLTAHIKDILAPCEKAFTLPDVPLKIILVCGVNSSGKTTTIAKLCHFLKLTDVGIIAADTFRAAAIDQLQVWGDRLNIPVYTGSINADPASVVYQGIEWAKEKNLNTLIIDTAGRLQNKQNLMDELGKIKRIIQKIIPDAPHETILVLDGTTGSNAIIQAQIFNDVTPITGLIMTKLDGTAKGGALISIADTLKLPIYFIGTGEKENDLISFNTEIFLKSVLE